MKRFVGAWALVMGMAGSQQAATIHVATNGSHDAANNFDTWNGAATNLNEAVVLANSLIASNTHPKTTYTAGVQLNGGVLLNCTVAGNSNGASSTQGGGVNRTAGVITNGIIQGNIT